MQPLVQVQLLKSGQAITHNAIIKIQSKLLLFRPPIWPNLGYGYGGLFCGIITAIEPEKEDL